MDSILFFIIGGLFVVIIVEFFFLQWMVDSVGKEKKVLIEDNSRLIKAIMAKNAHDYVMTTSIDKVSTEVATPKDPSEIPEENLTDDEFFAAIGRTNKATEDKE